MQPSALRLFSPQRLERIHLCRASRRSPARDDGGRREEHGRDDERQRIAGRHSEQALLDRAREHNRDTHPERGADRRDPEALAEDGAADVAVRT